MLKSDVSSIPGGLPRKASRTDQSSGTTQTRERQGAVKRGKAGFGRRAPSGRHAGRGPTL